MKVVHFEIPAENPEQLGKFYEKVFNWKIKQWGQEQYWLAETGPKEKMGIGGAIYKKSPEMDRTVNTIGVENIEESMKMVKENGGRIKGEVMDIPGVGKDVMAFDPEGNLFGMIEPLPEMKDM
jgi:predicted enzyme related to lactoylglutathione lyase